MAARVKLLQLPRSLAPASARTMLLRNCPSRAAAAGRRVPAVLAAWSTATPSVACPIAVGRDRQSPGRHASLRLAAWSGDAPAAVGRPLCAAYLPVDPGGRAAGLDPKRNQAKQRLPPEAVVFAAPVDGKTEVLHSL